MHNLADKLLRFAVAIICGGVDEIDAARERVAQGFLVRERHGVEAITPEADAARAQSGFAENALRVFGQIVLVEMGFRGGGPAWKHIAMLADSLREFLCRWFALQSHGATFFDVILEEPSLALGHFLKREVSRALGKVLPE